MIPYPAVPLTLDRPRTLRLDFRACAVLHQRFGLDLLAPGAVEALREAELEDVLCAMLAHEDPGVQPAALAKALKREGKAQEALAAVLLCIANDVGAGEKPAETGESSGEPETGESGGALLSLWTFGVGALGLQDAAFWRLTPRLFFGLVKRRAQVEQRWDYRFGVLAAAVGNFGMARPDEPLEPGDFFATVPKVERPVEWFLDQLRNDEWVLQEGSDEDKAEIAALLAAEEAAAARSTAPATFPGETTPAAGDQP